MNRKQLVFVQEQLQIEAEKWRRVKIHADAKILDCANRIADIEDELLASQEIQRIVQETR
jgi:hypothetical protein